ncbi:MAG: hypothetical protein LUI87_06330 [Lachnospiraceae bacterium]|nr:hypothetical protein [Lachnospiraceae bacterium]
MASVKSTDTSVVTVSSGGTVTAVGTGIAYVVFVASNGSSYLKQVYKYVVS